jgi:ketosteroid isomerase-like protein
MEQQNADFVRAMYAELNDTYKRGDALHHAHESGDFRELMPQANRTLHEDVVLSTPTESLFPEAAAGERRGREEVLRFVLSQTEGFEEMFIEPAEFIEVAGKVVVPLRFGGRARHTGIEVEFEVVHVLTIDKGKAKRIDIFMTRSEAMEALGLPQE